ncbi:MAG: DNA alkylation repair protein [Acidobacteriota bacterium]|nr:DNA alkylation repair protein [Acidobacteriota bacterium]
MAALADEERAKSSAWFFKTGAGQYGEGDRFLGIRVPVQRRLAHRYLNLAFEDIARLLASPIHEHRFTAVEILVAQYERAEPPLAEEIFQFYLKHARRINNWDLVDTSAPYIVGEHLKARSCNELYSLAQSDNIWERRISLVATLAFIKHGQLEETFRIAQLLLLDKHDLIHKAAGWALREAGRVSRPRLLAFLEEHYQSLPRTTLRYAIEHLPVEQRKLILGGHFR